MAGSWIEIDRARLLQNLAVFGERLGVDKKLMAVVKANAYGHGAGLVAPAVRDRVHWFGVDSLEEARELVDLGRPILILGHTEPSEAATIVEHGLRQALFRRDVAEALSSEARKRSVAAYVHLKVETGLHRLGVPFAEVEAWARDLAELDNVVVEGVYTHFADVEDTSSTFFETQLERLRKAVAVLRAHGHEPSLVHASPSAGVLLHPRDDLTLGRVGIGLFGIWPSAATRRAAEGRELRPVLAWKCRIAQVKAVPKGSSVGYEATYRAPDDRRVGVLPVGYYDGYDRKLSNRGQVLVRGKRVPVVGRVAMNMTMVDVTEAWAEAGDEVELLGDTITADEVASWAETIPYEVVARLSARLPRRLAAG